MVDRQVFKWGFDLVSNFEADADLVNQCLKMKRHPHFKPVPSCIRVSTRRVELEYTYGRSRDSEYNNNHFVSEVWNH